MLQAMRDRATGLISWVIIGMLILGFVFWQIGDYLGIGAEPSAAEINDVKITESQFKREYARIISQRGKVPAEHVVKKIKTDLIDQLIQASVEYQGAQYAGYQVGELLVDRKVRSIPQFQVNGKFSQIRLENVLRNIGYRYKGFYQQMVQDMSREQFVYGITGGEFISRKELDSILKAQYRKIDIEYIRIVAKKFRPSILYNDAILEKYYKKTIKEYEVAAKIKLSYLQLAYQDVAKKVKPDKSVDLKESDYKQYYESQKSNYRTAAIRKAAHIFFKLKKEANKAAVATAMLKAKKVHAKLKKGNFAALLKKHSDDKLSPGGDLGVIDPDGNIVLYQAIEKLNKGQFSEPIRSDSGIHILKVTFAKEGNIKTFAQTRSEIVKTMKAERLADHKKKIVKEFLKQSEELDDLARENPESLDSAAQSMGLKVQHTDWFSLDSKDLKGLAADEAVRNAAFKNKDLFADGDPGTSENVFLDINRDKPNALSVVLHLKEYVPIKAKPFKEVKEKVKQNFIKAEIAKKSKELADKLFKDLKAGKKLAELAKTSKFKLTKAKKLSRGATKYPKKLIAAAFKLGVPAKSKLLANSVQLDNGDAILVKVTGSDVGEQKGLNKQVKMFHRQMQEQLFARKLMTSVLEALTINAEITRHKKIIYSDGR